MSMIGIFKDAATKAGNFCRDNIRGRRMTLRDAIEKHDWGKAGAILQQNPEAADWDLQDASLIKRKALHVAAEAGDFNIFSILLRPEFFKGDIDVRDSQGATPLILAAREGNDLLVQVLIAKGADVNAVDRLGRSALGSAAQFCRTASMKMLLDNGAAVNGPKGSRTPLGEASRAGYCWPAVKMLLDAGADPDYIGQLKQSALEVCLENANIEAAIELLKAGANPNNTSPVVGAGLLRWAISINHTQAVELLLVNGADPLLSPGDGRCNALEYTEKTYLSLEESIRNMVAERGAALAIKRNTDAVQKGIAAGTSTPITIKPIKLRIS